MVIVHIAPEENKMYSDMEYFVAKVEEVSHKLTRGEVHGSNQYLAGWYAAKIHWFERRV